MPYEIERKYLITQIPKDLSMHPCFQLEQGYLNTHPTVRIRKENNEYYLTYKNGTGVVHEEYNLPLDAAAYIHMKTKCDGLLIKKKRYKIPMIHPVYSKDLSETDKSPSLTIELDIFEESLAPLVYAEVEFTSENEANAFVPPTWFGTEVTLEPLYSNASLSQYGIPKQK